MCQVFLIQPQIVFHSAAAAAVLQFKIIESVYVWLLDALNCPGGKSFLPLGPNNPLQPQKNHREKKKKPTSLIPVTHLFSSAVWRCHCPRPVRTFNPLVCKTQHIPPCQTQPALLSNMHYHGYGGLICSMRLWSLHRRKPIVVTSINI